MADQTTTIASLPAGYPTLAGAIYAVAVTKPPLWVNVAWWKLTRVGCKSMNHPKIPGNLQHVQRLEQLVDSLAKVLRTPKLTDVEDNKLLRNIAAFHYVRSTLLDLLQQPMHGNPVPADLQATSPKTVINFYDHTHSKAHSSEVYLSITEFQDITKELWIESTASIEAVRCCTASATFNTDVHVQLAAPGFYRVVELGYKAIEVLVGVAVVLGSTGGAWLGLTISSLFPERTAAGFWRTSYGQRKPPIESTQLTSRGVGWRMPGTVWCNATQKPLELLYYEAPAKPLPDEWREMLGYILQYFLLWIIQWFKLDLRNALEFGRYTITVDAVRYVLLVAELGILVTTFITLKRRASHRLTAQGHRAVAVYLIMLAASLACVVLGQKAFLKPVWKFYLVSKLVDLIATVGSIAVLYMTWEPRVRDKDSDFNDNIFRPEQWILLWAIGACTVVW